MWHMVGGIQVPSEEPPDAAIPQEGFSGYSRRGGDQSHHTESTWGFRCVRWFQGNFFLQLHRYYVILYICLFILIMII